MHRNALINIEAAQGTQLPVSAYIAPELLALERKMLFDVLPRYAGHELMVPEENDYHVLPHHADGILLSRQRNAVIALSNVCRHRQSPILQGRGNAATYSCPVHRWTYGNDGALRTAPKFTSSPCANLKRYELQRSGNGTLFLGPAAPQLSEVPPQLGHFLSFDGMAYGHTQVFPCEYNWKTFVEFYLEDYHVAPFHPGLGRFVSCEDLEWTFGATWSLQTVGFHRGLQQPGASATYQRWHQAVLDHFAGRLPEHAVAWYLHYPNFMIECYPMVTVVSTIYPITATRSVNIVDFFHPQELLRDDKRVWMARLAAEAYCETALEDDEIGRRMQKGRQLLHDRGENDTGAYHPVLELGMKHFHTFFRSRLGPELEASYLRPV